MQQLLEPPGDPLDLRHYLERLDQQFDRELTNVARAVLDCLASRESGLERQALVQVLSADRAASSCYLAHAGWARVT